MSRMAHDKNGQTISQRSASVSWEDYSTTIIGVPDKSYIWIMARTPTVDEAHLRCSSAVNHAQFRGELGRERKLRRRMMPS